jgi:hypothetical protein
VVLFDYMYLLLIFPMFATFLSRDHSYELSHHCAALVLGTLVLLFVCLVVLSRGFMSICSKGVEMRENQGNRALVWEKFHTAFNELGSVRKDLLFQTSSFS